MNLFSHRSMPGTSTQSGELDDGVFFLLSSSSSSSLFGDAVVRSCLL